VGTRYEQGEWSDDAAAHFFRSNLKEWQDLNPTFAIHVWDTKEVDALVAIHFPEWWHIFVDLPAVEQADIARLMILVSYGGWYADLDSLPLRSLLDITNEVDLETHTTILGVEDSFEPEHRSLATNALVRRIRKDERAGPEEQQRVANNFLFALRPGSATLKRCLRIAKTRITNTDMHQYPTHSYLTVFRTGPDVLTAAVQQAEESEGVKLLSAEAVPLHDCNLGSWKTPELLAVHQADNGYTDDTQQALFECRLGHGRLRQGAVGKVAAHLERSAQLDERVLAALAAGGEGEGGVQLWMLLGLELLRLELLDDAANAFEKQLRLTPTHVPTRLRSGICSSERGGHSAAIAALTAAIEAAEGSNISSLLLLEAHYRLGVSLSQVGRVEDAAMAQQAVIALKHNVGSGEQREAREWVERSMAQLAALVQAEGERRQAAEISASELDEL
jgi:tetratricopeptide (TPR) repeat protein